MIEIKFWIFICLILGWIFSNICSWIFIFKLIIDNRRLHIQNNEYFKKFF